MKRITKIGMWGITLMMLSACGNGTPDYDATGTFEATEVIVSAEAAGKLISISPYYKQKINRREDRSGIYRKNKKHGERNANGGMFTVFCFYRLFIFRSISLVSLFTRKDSIVFCSALL